MNERHRLIAVILDRREVTSQQQLVELLAEQGVAVTQATVSRDLDRLGAVRVRRNGHMVYALPEGDEPIDPQELLRQVLGSVLSIEAVVQPLHPEDEARAGDARRARLRPGRPDRGLRHDRRRRHDPADRARAGGRHRSSRRSAARCSSARSVSDAGPLWSGRLAGGLDPRVLAYSESLSVDRRLLPYDVRASQAHVRMLAPAGHHPGRRRGRHRGGARRRGARRRRERRGRPLADRAPAGRPARRDRQARARRPLAQRPGGDRVPALGRSTRRAGWSAPWPVCRPCWWPGPGRRRRPRAARATPTSSAPSRCRSATTWRRTRGRSSAMSTAAARGRGGGRLLAARRRRAGRLQPAARSRRRRAGARLRRPVRELRRRRLRPRLRGRPLLRLHPRRRAPLADRRGARAVDVAGVRVRGARRRRRPGVEHDAPEEEPADRGARARPSGASRSGG